MSKPIFANDVEAIIEELRKQLTKTKYCGHVNINYPLGKDDRKAALYFTADAWVKMTTLVSKFDTEVQWMGLVERISETDFKVYDILVPPQTVTSTTVDMKEDEYEKWLDGYGVDVSNIVFHGHSHVNMGVSPSKVDTDCRHNLLTQLPKPKAGDDVFYIFFIINKKSEWTGQIYDLTNNAIYDTNEITVDVVLDEDAALLNNFVTESRRVVVKETPAYSYGGAQFSGQTQFYNSKTRQWQSTPPEVQGGKKAKENGKTSNIETETIRYLKEAYDYDGYGQRY